MEKAKFNKLLSELILSKKKGAGTTDKTHCVTLYSDDDEGYILNISISKISNDNITPGIKNKVPFTEENFYALKEYNIEPYLDEKQKTVFFNTLKNLYHPKFITEPWLGFLDLIGEKTLVSIYRRR